MQINGNEVSWTTGILLVLLPDIIEKELQEKQQLNEKEMQKMKLRETPINEMQTKDSSPLHDEL